MRLGLFLVAASLLLAGCARSGDPGVSDTAGNTPQRSTPAAGASTPGDAPAGTGQNSPGTYGGVGGSATSQPGTGAANP